MAKLIQGSSEGWGFSRGENFDVYFKRTSQKMEELNQVSKSLANGQIVGAMIKFQVADGYAHYRVTNDKPLTVEHIPYGDAYRVHPAMIRGLTKQDVLAQIHYEKAMDKLFASKR